MFQRVLRLRNRLSDGILQHRFASYEMSFSTDTVTKAKALGLDMIGITNRVATVYHNLSFEAIVIQERDNAEGMFLHNGAFAVDTGRFTGLSLKDKWIVKQEPSEGDIRWGDFNQPMEMEVFDELYEKVMKHYNSITKMYVFDGYCGSKERIRKNVRIITEFAWQHHFATNMFLRPRSNPEINDFLPDFTILNAAKVVNLSYQRHRTNSETFIAFSIEKNVAIIGGTWYAGEMQKAIFWMMNYWLPRQDILPMHCSANKGKSGDIALFFGPSGAGKTTLSVDPHRLLVGDDEHGWDDDGIFNLEGGCYTRLLDRSEETESGIYQAIRSNALLENVLIGTDKNPDYKDGSKTQNARVAFPLDHVESVDLSGIGGHPKNIILLTYDAYGVLPPVAKLDVGQAVYHFLSGYSAKLVGTDRSDAKPQATFSACFAEEFLPLHPTVYADLFHKRIQQHGSNVFLVNTGWIGSCYGSADRINIKFTKICINAILDGSINECEFERDPTFGFWFPTTLAELPYGLLNPREAWADKFAYDQMAATVAGLFIENFKKYIAPARIKWILYGPKLV